MKDEIAASLKSIRFTITEVTETFMLVAYHPSIMAPLRLKYS